MAHDGNKKKEVYTSINISLSAKVWPPVCLDWLSSERLVERKSCRTKHRHLAQSENIVLSKLGRTIIT